MSARAALLGVALAAMAAVSPGRAAETVQVRAGEHKEGYARIAVEWPAPARFDAKLDGNTLTIRFARPFAAQLATLAGKLKDYVASIAQSADGTAIVAQLKRPVEIKTSTINGRVATIDLVAHGPPAPDRPAAKPDAKAETQPKSARPAPRGEGESVRVRGAEHAEGFARIAVEWPAPVSFEAKLEGESLTIRFARAFKAPLAPLARTLDHYIAHIEQSADGTAILAQLKRPVEIRTRTVDNRIAAIDLVALAKARPERPQAKPEEAARQANPPRDVTPPAKTEEPAASSPASVQPAEAAPTLAPPSHAPAEPVAAAAPDPGTAMSLTPLLAKNSDRSVSLRFDWPMPTDAAIYRRGGAVWIVFAAPTTLDLSAIRTAKSAAVEAVDQVQAEGATALRVITADGINPSVRRAGNAWIVDLKAQDAVPDSPIVVDPRPIPPKPSVELHVHGAGLPLPLRDPILGDRLTVVPVGDVGRGIDATRDFVDFRLLPSVQGIVVRPKSDDLVIASKENAVDISRPKGLVLSNETDRLLARSTPSRHRVFDFAAWRGPRGVDFSDRRSALDRAIAHAAPAARTRPRLDLAHFYFAHLFGPEALSVMAQIARDDPKAAAEPAFRALKGAACVLADDADCAAKELGTPDFDKEPELGLWRGAYAAGRGDWAKAARDFLDGVGFLATYPPRLRNRLALQAAEALIETDRAASATPLLDLVSKLGGDERDQAMALYLRGRVDQQLGEIRPALELWTRAAAMDDRKARARALYAKAMALYEAKEASTAQTINALDALRFAWRGDDFEFTLLRRLGELKLQENDTEGGLEALHLAAAYFPDYPAAKDLTKEAARAFIDLFTGKGADDMPPVKALALYDQFHDLVPAGAEHDAIVRKLVDRLVSVDLLDRAADLLSDQVKGHLSGLDKARAATQLALLRLMNHQPEQAVAALDIDVAGGLTPDLGRQRQELRARALLDLGRAAEALAMLANDNSRDAYRLRADIYWHQRDWKNAARIFALLAGEPPAKGPLDAETARLVLSWAAALTLAGDRNGLAKLRDEFGPAMAGTKAADAFSIIAADDNEAAEAGGTPSQIAARVAQLGALQNFIAAYKQRLASDKLSTIN